MISLRSTFLFISCVALLYSCSSNEKARKASCKESFSYGNATFCLPTIAGMKNYYADSTIRKWADTIEAKTNSVHALYLSDSMYQKVLSSREIFNDNFLKVFTIDGMADHKSDSVYLEQVANSIVTSNTFHDLKDLSYKLALGTDFISPWQPLYVDRYSPHPHVRSFVMMLKYQRARTDLLLMCVLNIMLMNDRLIGSNYYKQYQGIQTIEDLRTTNDTIVKQMMWLNAGAKG